MGNDLPILDQLTLAKLRSDVGDESADFLVQSLKQEIRTSDVLFRGYLKEDNMSLLETQAHALKSATRSFGALRLGEVCLAIEEGAKQALGPQVIGELLSNFGQVSSETLAAFEQL